MTASLKQRREATLLCLFEMPSSSVRHSQDFVIKMYDKYEIDEIRSSILGDRDVEAYARLARRLDELVVHLEPVLDNRRLVTDKLADMISSPLVSCTPSPVTSLPAAEEERGLKRKRSYCDPLRAESDSSEDAENYEDNQWWKYYENTSPPPSFVWSPKATAPSTPAPHTLTTPLPSARTPPGTV